MRASRNGQPYVLADGTIVEGAGPPSTPEDLRVYLTCVRGHKTFHRELEQLMKEYPRQWVAYHGNRRLGIARTQLELYQTSVRQGIPERELVIRSIEPEMPELVIDPFGLDGDEEISRTR